MYDYNDHTDAEYDRREQAFEMGATTEEEDRFEKWSDAVEAKLVELGFTTVKQGLDGDQTEDGFSLDFACDAFDAGSTVDEYVADVIVERNARGIR